MSQANFRSDNESGVAPQIMAALERANGGSAHSYGEDPISERLTAQFRELFDFDLAVFPLATGTAANALSIAQLSPAYGAVYCHAHAHLNTDECGAPEFYTAGAKLIALKGAAARIGPTALSDALAATGDLGDHECKPSALSLSQATEFGTVYQPAHIAELAAIAHERGLGVHMDGARFANAVQHLGCAPADVTWRAGVDMLSFGATKNGAMAAEAILVFKPALAEALGRRRKRAGHLISKMRFVSAQLEAYIADDLWLELAAKANAAATALGDGLAALPGVELLYPVEANEVFARIPEDVAAGLAEQGFEFHRWPGTADVYRLVAAFDTPPAAVRTFLEAIARLAG